MTYANNRMKKEGDRTMPRPRKCRRVCTLPARQSFGPLDGIVNENLSVILSVDEYECIRLIDLAGMTQEECANQMGVARTTAQAIYASAREKLADCIVNGKKLQIKGGDFVIYGGASACGCGCCHTKRHNKMKTGGNEHDSGSSL